MFGINARAPPKRRFRDPRFLQHLLGTSNDYAIALSSRLTHDFFGGLANTVGIHHLHPLSIQCAFEAAAQERLEEPVVKGVSALLTLFDGRTIAAQYAGDLDGKQFV